MRKFLAINAALALAACGADNGQAQTDQAQTGQVQAEVAAPAPAPAYAPMAPFARLDGTSWIGEGKGPDGQPIVDMARYELILDGRAFQSTHRLKDGTYGGRSIFFYDESAQSYVYHYFTTAGFHTIGEVTPTGNGFTATEKVIGHPTYAEVRGAAEIGDGIITVTSSHVTHDGKASEGDVMIYRQVDPADVTLFGDGR